MKLSYVAMTWMTACLMLVVDCRRSIQSSMSYSHPQTADSDYFRTPREGSPKVDARRGDPSILEQKHQEVVLKTNEDKIKALRWKLLNLISHEAKQLSSNNQSIVSIAFLAFGVILFDVLTDAIFGDQSNLVASLVGGVPQSRETMLPGLGLFGDNLNNLAEVVLNMLTIYLYRDESPDCGERLLCESNQQAVSRGFLDSLVTYISGFSVSFFLRQAPISRNLEAMRAGRKGQNCIELYPNCSISL